MRVPKRYRDVWYLLEVTTAAQGVGREREFRLLLEICED